MNGKSNEKVRKKMKIRCKWCEGNELDRTYHDEEWGVPVHDDRKQFEYLMMEVMQCGLSWNLMLKKREIFRRCFDNFDYQKVSSYGEKDISRILETPGMIRSERKIKAVISNAVFFEKIIAECGSFDRYIWGFTGGKTIIYKSHQQELAASNELSEKVSKDLRKRCFKYLGPVTVYSHLQACGVINDHEETCFRYGEICKLNTVEYRE